GNVHFEFFEALRSNIRSCFTPAIATPALAGDPDCAPAYGSKEQASLRRLCDPNKFGSGTNKTPQQPQQRRLLGTPLNSCPVTNPPRVCPQLINSVSSYAFSAQKKQTI